MANPEGCGGIDPRLASPDEYFGAKYADVMVTVSYGRENSESVRSMTIAQAIAFENMARRKEDIEADPPERRANIFIEMLRPTGRLLPEDDITYLYEKG